MRTIVKLWNIKHDFFTTYPLCYPWGQNFRRAFFILTFDFELPFRFFMEIFLIVWNTEKVYTLEQTEYISKSFHHFENLSWYCKDLTFFTLKQEKDLKSRKFSFLKFSLCLFQHKRVYVDFEFMGIGRTVKFATINICIKMWMIWMLSY